MGRPTTYNKELGERICLEIAHKTISLKRICGSNEDFPDKSTIYDWIIKHKEFADLYARAREAQAHLMAEEIIEIADDSRQDNETRYAQDGTPYVVENKEWTSRVKLQIDARKWLASKLLPKKYGDRLDLDHTSNGKDIFVVLPPGKKQDENDTVV